MPALDPAHGRKADQVVCAICCCVALAPRLDYGRKAPLLRVRDRNPNGGSRGTRLRAPAYSPVPQRDARMARKRGWQYIATGHAERRSLRLVRSVRYRSVERLP